MRIILLGLPGSGKGTQARALARAFSIPYVGTGDLLRREIANDTSLGRELAPVLEKGDFPPDALVANVFLGYLLDQKDVVCEGFPRNDGQRILLDQALEDASVSLDHVFYLDIDADTALKRLRGRYTCLSCGAPYNWQEKKQSTCAFCGGKHLGQRSDDVDGVMQKRLVVQTERDHDLIQAYRERPYFHRIDAGQPQERVLREMMGYLEKSSEESFS